MQILRKHLIAIQALIIRDLMVRYGRHHLGFIWTVLEPMILTSGVMLVWSLIKEPIIHGIPVITFVLTGYMPLTLWRHLLGPMTRILRSHSTLMYHRPISHIDIMLGRCVLEFLATSAALVVVCFVVMSTGVVDVPADPGLSMLAWVFTAWYFGAMGLLVGALTEYWDPIEKFIQPLQYLSLPVSGVFFMVGWVPGYAQKLLLWNPSVHCFEMFRAGFLGESIAAHYDVAYLAACSTAMTIAAAAAVYQVRDHVEIQV